MADSMHALVLGHGPDWELVNLPVPEPGPGEVLVRNRAAATNNADIAMIAAADPTSGGTGEQSIAGYEFAGEIAAVGADVVDWRVGDPVMGTYPRSFAEYLVVDGRFVLPRPADLAPEVACALPTALLTEFGALRVAGFSAGDSVLLTGASTGIGLIGIRIARELGASTVIATTRDATKVDLLTSLGADAVIVTTQEDLVAATRAATGGRGADVTLDHVAGEVFAQCLAATAEDGHVVNIGRLAGPSSTVDLDALSYRHLTVHGVSFGFSRDWETVPILEALRERVLPAVAAGRIRPVIDGTVPAAAATQTAQRIRSGAAIGKSVITF